MEQLENFGLILAFWAAFFWSSVVIYPHYGNGVPMMFKYPDVSERQEAYIFTLSLPAFPGKYLKLSLVLLTRPASLITLSDWT